jgi:hypothetical protein
MFKLDDISKTLSEQGIKLRYPLVGGNSDGSRIIAFVEVRWDTEGTRRPSDRKLSRTALAFSNDGIEIEFILVNEKAADNEEELRSSLLNGYGDYIRNSFLIVGKKGMNITLVPKKDEVKNEIDAIKNFIIRFFKAKELIVESIELTTEVNLITKTGCIAIIRRFAPIGLEDLKIEIEKRGFVVPSDDWLSRMLDNLRKSSLVVRKKSGGYAMTLAGLRAAGTSKNSRSPDIARMLALARRPK